MIRYRKIGGLHWLFIGRFRLAWCWRKNKHTSMYVKSYVLTKSAPPFKDRGVLRQAQCGWEPFSDALED